MPFPPPISGPVRRLLFCAAVAFGLALPARLCAAVESIPAGNDGRVVVSFNADWRFTKSDSTGAEAVAFDDSGWTTISTPHTYNDEDTFDDWALPGHRGEQNQWSGRTWYRKTFVLPESYRGKRIYIEFEAVRQVAEVYLNGRLLGTCKTGFTPFGFDLTPYLNFGDTPNVVAVMCDNRFMMDPPPAAPDGAAPGTVQHKPTADVNLRDLSAAANREMPADLAELRADQIPWNNPHWHPAHGGIYRNVFLHITDPVHIPLPLYSFLQTAGPYVYSTDVTADSAKIVAQVPVVNSRRAPERVELRITILDATGATVGTAEDAAHLDAGATHAFELSHVVRTPRFWEPGSLYLYRIVCSVVVGGHAVDQADVPLGIRIAHWNAATGLLLNGRREKLHGWGQKPTNEWPGLGAAQPDWLHHYTLSLMKKAGGNFVRWGHCAGGPASIKSADRLGLITVQPGVDGESDTVGAAWELRAAAFRDVLIYFRNHPSILIWEAGNQKVSSSHARELRELVSRFDPHGGRSVGYRRADSVTAEFMDVVIGTEGSREIAALPVVEGEYNREESPRRVWDDHTPPTYGYPEAKGQTYHLTSEQFAINQVAHFHRKLGRPEHAGGANWIFSDSTSGGRNTVEVARTSGEVDGMRLPKEAYFACQAMFSAEPRVHIIGHWNYPAGTTKPIFVVSACESVELFLNGRSLGRGRNSDRYLFTFDDVAWQPGELKAVGYIGEHAVASHLLRTAGEPVALRLTAILGPTGLQADGSDIALIDVEAVDATGARCPTFVGRVDFDIEGPASWCGGYNSGRPASIRKRFLDLECGINRVALRATRTSGKITVTARSGGVASGTVAIEAQPVSIAHGLQYGVPVLPEAQISETHVAADRDWFATRASTTQQAGQALASGKPGRYIATFSYSGPSSSIVHVEQDAQPGKNAYVDADSPFPTLPVELQGADWIQIAQGDRKYSAVDLVQLGLEPETVLFLAFDAALPEPAWLTSQFEVTGLSLSIRGRTMRVFARSESSAGSVTLGSQAESGLSGTENMYLVFVQRRPAP